MGDPEENLRPLFDFDTDTCLNVINALFNMKRNRLDLIIPQKIEDRLVRVYFNQKIACEERKVKSKKKSVSSIKWRPLFFRATRMNLAMQFPQTVCLRFE